MSKSMEYFDPSECIRGIQQLLVSDKKKIAFLFGAGTSLAKKNKDSPFVPAIGQMTQLVIKNLSEDSEMGVFYEAALKEIENELKLQSINFNIETLLSNIEDKIRIIGEGKLNNLKKSDFQEMNEKIKSKILDLVSVHKSFKEKDIRETLIHYDFAKWICNADRKHAVEIFTTNYDYLIEIGLEAAGLPYYDGFTGSYKPFFNSDSLEDINYLPQQTKLWKIHGSLGLHEDKMTKKIIRMSSDKDDLLIYPSSLKYSNSKKQPYAAFMDRLNAFLKQDDVVLFVCGYSFSDEHINERIFSALKTNSTAHAFIFYYDIVWEEDIRNNTFNLESKLGELATNNRKISILSTRNAIIGGKFGEWQLKREPDKDDTLNVSWYFDEDAPINHKAAIGVEHSGDEVWTGKGELTLPSFKRLTDFLKRMIPKSDWEVKEND